MVCLLEKVNFRNRDIIAEASREVEAFYSLVSRVHCSSSEMNHDRNDECLVNLALTTSLICVSFKNIKPARTSVQTVTSCENRIL